MNFVKKIISSTFGSAVKDIGSTIKQFVTTDKDRAELQIKIEEILAKRDSDIESTIRSELDAKARIIESEMAQGDNYTKRARPTVVYVGLLMAFINYCFLPALALANSAEAVTLPIPPQFWYVWGGVCSTWVVGRSAEKRGAQSKVIDLVTGGHKDVKRIMGL